MRLFLDSRLRAELLSQDESIGGLSRSSGKLMGTHAASQEFCALCWWCRSEGVEDFVGTGGPFGHVAGE